MREIKFRAWNSIDKCMCDNSTTLTNLRGFIKSKHYHPMQYTGLKDKNGVEIYEGDVLTHEDFCDEACDMIVEMDERGCFVARDKVNASDFIYVDDLDFVVIGNIHQNPELLSD